MRVQKLKNLFHLFQAIGANIIYGFPSRKLKVIGVTGTDGKTTTVHLIAHILKNTGKKVSFISSVYAKIGEEKYDTGFHVTTLNPLALQRLLRESVESGDEYFILETTSHALDQCRVWGIKYCIGVVTNITHEHLDYHKTYEEYVKTKTKLLLSSQITIINEEDKSFKLLNKILRQKNKKFIKYRSHPELVSGSDFGQDGYSTVTRQATMTKEMLKQVQHDIFSQLPKFNQYNYSAAYTTAKILGLSDGAILKAMKSFQLPPGRLDIVYDKDFKVIIDFGHTPNALENVLKTIKESYLEREGRMIHVFGSAGRRDNSKRPLMGEASGKYTDIVILTEEDYRTEDLLKICEQIAIGLTKQNFSYKKYNLIEQNDEKIYTIIKDRQEAISKAIEIAKKDDVVITTGKGHEKSLCREKIEYPWDEKNAVMKAINSKSQIQKK